MHEPRRDPSLVIEPMSAVRVHDANAVGRDWVVGDIHGCFSTLDRLLADVNFDPARDRMFSVGDLVDRGPESHRVTEYLAQPWFHAVLGNHEQYLIDAEAGDPEQHAVWRANGGDWFFERPIHEQQAMRRAVAELPYARQVQTHLGPVGIVHGDVPANQTWPEFVGAAAVSHGAREAALWGRGRALGRHGEGVAGVYRVYCGHTPQWRGVRVVDNVYCIDTGAVFGLIAGVAEAVLTVMQLPDGEARSRAPSELLDIAIG